MSTKTTAAADQRKEKRNSILITIAVILVAACIIGLVVYNNLADRGYFLRKSIAAQSENFEVNGTMMTYLFYSNYNQYASTFSQYFGLNTSVSLKSQESGLDDSGSTWFDYFAYMTENYVGELLALCEGAKAAGVELDADDIAAIDESIASLTDIAASYGYTVDAYLMTAFGSGVKEQDVRDCMMLTTLASKYYSEYSENLSYTDEEYDAYYEANKDSFQKVDMISYTIKQDDLIEKDANGNPVGNVTDASAKAKEYADNIAACATSEDFNNAILAYATDVLGLSAEDAEAAVAAAEQTGAAAVSGDDASTWAFSAKTGETTVISASGGTAYTVCYLVNEVYRDDTPTRSVRHILLMTDTYGEETEAKARELYAQWEATNFDLDEFSALCLANSEDTGSSSNGGLYENVSKGDMVEAFDAWLFDESRVVGDTGLVESEEYGWHIMYYAGEGMPAWKASADDSMRSDDYSELITEYSKNIVFDQDVVYSINA